MVVKGYYGICSLCKKVKPLMTHHLIPRYISISPEEVIEVCAGCHTKLECKFKNLILWGQFKTVRWLNEAKREVYMNKYKSENKDKMRTYSREYYRKKLAKHPGRVQLRFRDPSFKDKIESLYCNKKLSQKEVGQKLNYSQGQISHMMRKWGIPIRTPSETVILIWKNWRNKKQLCS